MKKLEGKIAVVTGASKGIGSSIAKHLAAAGATVVVNYASSREGADRTVAEIAKAGGKAVAVQADVSKKADVTRLFAEVKSQFGHVDVLVNNAGIYEFAPLEDITEEGFHRQFNINVLGTLLATQEAVKHFTPAGGSVINLSSIVSTNAFPGSSVYSGTKAALNAVTQALAKELGARKIRVNAVAPGMVETEGTATAGFTDAESAMRKQIESQTPVGRIGQPQDIGTVATFLASDDAAWVSGETWFVSGGFR